MHNKCSRRQFLKLAGSGALSATLLSPRLLLAQSLAESTGKNLVLINLTGGCDGLSLFPYIEGPLSTILSSIRPTITPAGTLEGHSQSGIANKLGFHPALAPLQNVIRNNGKIIQKYGILTDLGRSHDVCQLVMDLGTSQAVPLQRGFMARFADYLNFELFQYWGFADSAAYFAFNTDKAVPLVVQDLDSLNFGSLWTDWGNEDTKFVNEMRQNIIESQVVTGDAKERYKRSFITIGNAIVKIRSDIATQTVGSNAAGNYSDTTIGKGLRDTAKVLRAKAALGQANKITSVYLTHDGFDHHSGQIDPDSDQNFSALIGALSSNLAVFVEDLRISALWDKTVIVLFSEFGRTIRENGRQGQPTVGTDHGWGNSTLVLGGSVSPGIVGDAPDSGELTNQDVNALIPTIDYRDIFSGVFSWMGIEPSVVFDESGYRAKNIALF